MWFLNEKGFFNIDNIEIVIGNAVEQPTYLKPLVADLDHSLEAWRGQSLWQLDLEKIKSQISKREWLKDVRLRRQWPSRLSVVIAVKEVRFLMIGKNGEMYPVTEDSQVLPRVELGQSPDVMLTQSEAIWHQVETRKLAVKAVESLPVEGSFSRRSISELQWKDKEGISMVLVNSGLKVKLGFDKFATKGFRVGQVLDYMKAQSKNIDGIDLIDADLSNKVIVRRASVGVSRLSTSTKALK